MPAEGRIARVVAHVTRQPYLLDHRVQGKVVLAVVQVLEWFVRMPKHCDPGNAWIAFSTSGCCAA